MGNSEPPDILYETYVCIIHTNLQLHIIETLHDQSFSRDFKPPVIYTGYPRTKGQESVYETCACVILLSYMCISIVIHINVCAGYMCFVKLYSVKTDIGHQKYVVTNE